jgi:hypothetical protein
MATRKIPLGVGKARHTWFRLVCLGGWWVALYLSWAGVGWCTLAGGGVPCILVGLFCSLLLGVFSASGV